MVSPCSAVGSHFNYSFPEPKLSLSLTLQQHTIYIIVFCEWMERKVMPPKGGNWRGEGIGGAVQGDCACDRQSINRIESYKTV